MITNIRHVLNVTLIVFSLLLFLFGNNIHRDLFEFAITQILTVSQSPAVQWLVMLTILIYLAVLISIQLHRSHARLLDIENPDLWLSITLAIGITEYALNYSSASQSTDLLIFAFGIVLGKGATMLTSFRFKTNWIQYSHLIVYVILILLLFAYQWQPENSNIIKYRGQSRWPGPWNNPNTYGLLMGVGLSLAVGMGALRWHNAAMGRTTGRFKLTYSWRFLFIGVCIVSACFLARGLLHSYSRGAWVATFCSLVYMGFQWLKLQNSKVSKWIRRNAFVLVIIILSTNIVVFWHLKHTKHEAVASRVISAANINDLSWRNRVAAWEGTFQIIGDKPWFGFGWNVPEPLYEHYYLSSKLDQITAIGLNDYLMLGATLGIPALFFFGIYLILALSRHSIFDWSYRSCLPLASDASKVETFDPTVELLERQWFQTTCCAGAIVLVIGFWFEGGFFNLPTASMFWILLELGSSSTKKNISDKYNGAPLSYSS